MAVSGFEGYTRPLVYSRVIMFKGTTFKNGRPLSKNMLMIIPNVTSRAVGSGRYSCREKSRTCENSSCNGSRYEVFVPVVEDLHLRDVRL